MKGETKMRIDDDDFGYREYLDEEIKYREYLVRQEELRRKADNWILALGLGLCFAVFLLASFFGR